jgi:hypothetical protein
MRKFAGQDAYESYDNRDEMVDLKKNDIYCLGMVFIYI